MKKITLWCEGYATTGQSSEAMFCGTYKVNNVKDAIKQYRDTLTDIHSKNCIDIKNESFWGCKFFDNEKKARRSFG